MLTIYQSDEAYTTEVKPNKCISIQVVRIIFYQEENGQFGSTLTLLITNAFTLLGFPPKFLPHLTICLDISKNFKIRWSTFTQTSQANINKQTYQNTYNNTLAVIYNNRFFSKMNGSFDPLHVRWIFLQRFERTEMMLAHGTRQGCSSASRTHKC